MDNDERLKMLLEINPFALQVDRRKRLGQILNYMKSESCKSPFDEHVIDFLELTLEYQDNSPDF